MLRQEASCLESLLSSSSLPALPQSALALVRLSQDPDNGPAELAVPIEADPGLTGQVLRFVNSSYYGFRHEIANVRQAITLVGARALKNFVLWHAVYSLIPEPRCGPFELKTLWQDSLRRALFARRLAQLLARPDAEDVFTAALLQDMALPLLAHALPDVYSLLFERRESAGCRLSQLEQEQFGWTHAEAGGMLARHWQLPERSACLIETHTAVPDAEGDAQSVTLSSLLPSLCDACWHEQSAATASYDALANERFPALDELLVCVDHDCGQLAPMLQL